MIGHIFKGNDEFVTGEKEGMGGGATPSDQVAKVVEVLEVGQATR